MRMMATGDHLFVDDTCKGTIRRWKDNGEDVMKKFKYKLPFDWHFRYRHVVNNQKNIGQLKTFKNPNYLRTS